METQQVRFASLRYLCNALMAAAHEAFADVGRWGLVPGIETAAPWRVRVALRTLQTRGEPIELFEAQRLNRRWFLLVSAPRGTVLVFSESGNLSAVGLAQHGELHWQPAIESQNWF